MEKTMSNVERYTKFIAEQVRKSGVLIVEDTNSPEYHKSQFEKHAKLARGHQAAANSSDAAEDDKLLDHHDDKMNEHQDKAADHADAYHKLTGKKLKHPPIDDQHDYVGYRNVTRPKAGSAPHDDDQAYLPKEHQTDSYKN
jgi:hypothetical protein